MPDNGKFSRTMRIDLLSEAGGHGEEAAEEQPAARRQGVSTEDRAAAAETGRVGGAEFRALFHGIYEAAILTSPEGNILDLNVRARQYLHYDNEDLVGRPILSIFSGAGPAVIEDIRKHLENDQFVLLQAYCVVKGGALMPVEVSVSRMTLGENAMLCFLLRDITPRRRAEARLRRTLAELQRSNADLVQFAYVVSHDLQEPLRKLLTFGDMLHGRHGAELPETAADLVTRMQSAATRMRSLIESLLRLSRVNTRARPFLPVDLDRVLKEVIGDMDSRLQETGGQIEADELPAIEAEEVQMRQLFQNLIGNALKYHRPGIPPVVRVSAVTEPAAGGEEDPDAEPVEMCRITVADNGIGFKSEDADRIFGIFQRLHHRHEYEGTGIGLSICRRIAERHGGALHAAGTPGGGARFVVSLPVTQPAEPEDEEDED